MERLSMRKIRELLRLRFEVGLSARQVAASVQIARSSVGEYERRLAAADLSWPLPEGLSDTELETHRYELDLNSTYQELARHYHVAIVPARVRRARDKAQQGVLLIERWILAVFVIVPSSTSASGGLCRLPLPDRCSQRYGREPPLVPAPLVLTSGKVLTRTGQS
jgi:hypothetical protein